MLILKERLLGRFEAESIRCSRRGRLISKRKPMSKYKDMSEHPPKPRRQQMSKQPPILRPQHSWHDLS